jgi:hypothetical protein
VIDTKGERFVPKTPGGPAKVKPASRQSKPETGFPSFLQRFALTAWVFLPHPAAAGHTIIYLPHPLRIAQAMSAIKVSSTIATNHGQREKGGLWQERFPSLRSGQAFDHALGTVKDYLETAECIHLNPVKQGLVKRPDQVAWTWKARI